MALKNLKNSNQGDLEQLREQLDLGRRARKGSLEGYPFARDSRRHPLAGCQARHSRAATAGLRASPLLNHGAEQSLRAGQFEYRKGLNNRMESVRRLFCDCADASDRSGGGGHHRRQAYNSLRERPAAADRVLASESERHIPSQVPRGRELSIQVPDLPKNERPHPRL